MRDLVLVRHGRVRASSLRGATGGWTDLPTHGRRPATRRCHRCSVSPRLLQGTTPDAVHERPRRGPSRPLAPIACALGVEALECSELRRARQRCGADRACRRRWPASRALVTTPVLRLRCQDEGAETWRTTPCAVITHLRRDARSRLGRNGRGGDARQTRFIWRDQLDVLDDSVSQTRLLASTRLRVRPVFHQRGCAPTSDGGRERLVSLERTSSAS